MRGNARKNDDDDAAHPKPPYRRVKRITAQLKRGVGRNAYAESSDHAFGITVMEAGRGGRGGAELAGCGDLGRGIDF